MAEDIQTTLQFRADITDFKGAMQEANRAVKLANSEFASTSTSMDDWGKSTDGLSAKVKQLTTVQAAEERKLAVLQEAYRQTVEEQGENSAAAQELAAKINNQQAAVNKVSGQIKKYKEELEDMEESSVSAEKATENLGNIAKGVTTVFAAVAAAATAVVTGFFAMAESSREYRTAMGKVATAFEDAGMSADMGKEMYREFYAVLGDQDKAVEAISNLALLTDDQQALAEWTDIATGIYAKFGDSLPIEGLTEAANETAKTGALTGALADALNWAGVSEEEFQARLDACTTTQEREALIRETLNGLYSEAGERYREVNADVIASNEAQARLTDAMATMGAKAEPILTAVKNGFATLAEKAAAFLTDANLEGISTAIDNAFAWLIDTALPTIQSGIDWVVQHKDIILALITGIAAGFAAWTVVQSVTSAVGALKTLKTTIDLVKTGQISLNAVMNANPIGIVITVVTALIAVFTTLWGNCEGFRNFFYNMWNGIKSFFATIVEWFGIVVKGLGLLFVNAWNAIKKAWGSAGQYFQEIRNKVNNAFSNVDKWMSDKFGSAWTAVKKAFSPFVGFFQQIWNTVRGVFSVVKSVLSGNFSDAWAAIKGVFSGWGSYFSGLWQDVKNAFSGAWSGMLNIGKNIVEGLWNGISSSFNWIKDMISGWVGNVMDFIKGLFGIHSPSTWAEDEVGLMIGRGAGNGIVKSARYVQSAARGLRDAVAAGLTPIDGAPPASGGVGAGKVVNFTQNNYSPKALTRREIYRRTYNALAYAGGG